jgi:tRNA-Thr(GGU) m(6)t(6)A37 methyltransferase TsaA
MKIELKPIGVVHSPFNCKEDIPCQGYKTEKIGEIEVFKKFGEGLKDIEGFSHIMIVYFFHKSENSSLHVKTFLDEEPHGIFACRHFNRPNPIGISVVELLERRGNKLKVRQIDVLDGTPLLDIKPYVPEFDERKNVKVGWLTDKLRK